METKDVSVKDSQHGLKLRGDLQSLIEDLEARKTFGDLRVGINDRLESLNIVGCKLAIL
jgi:hypothetical protein